MKMKQIGALAACLFAATQGVCETETVEALSLTADTTVDVPAGSTPSPDLNVTLTRPSPRTLSRERTIASFQGDKRGAGIQRY